MAQSQFSKSVRMTLARRAYYICSNPACRTLTLSLVDDEAPIAAYKGKPTPICASHARGARHDPTMTTNQRKSIENAIFLCSRCADMVSRNKGGKYPEQLLRDWKEQHKRWVRTHLNLREDAKLPSAPFYDHQKMPPPPPAQSRFQRTV